MLKDYFIEAGTKLMKCSGLATIVFESAKFANLYEKLIKSTIEIVGGHGATCSWIYGNLLDKTKAVVHNLFKPEQIIPYVVGIGLVIGASLIDKKIENRKELSDKLYN